MTEFEIYSYLAENHHDPERLRLQILEEWVLKVARDQLAQRISYLFARHEIDAREFSEMNNVAHHMVGDLIHERMSTLDVTTIRAARKKLTDAWLASQEKVR